MLHIKINDSELEEKIKKYSGVTYTKLVDELIAFKENHQLVSVTSPIGIKTKFNCIKNYMSPTGTYIPASNSKIRKVEILWDICYRLQLVGFPVSSNLYQFEESLVTRLYKFFFVGLFNEENFSDEHLQQVKKLVNGMNDEQKKIVAEALESHLIGGFGFPKAQSIIEKVFNLPLAVPERPNIKE
jgi:hypothetical protein